MATDEGSLPELAQYSPYYLPLNVYFASKGSNLYILFAITAAGVVPCGGPKKSPRTSSIVQIIFFFRSFGRFGTTYMCIRVLHRLHRYKFFGFVREIQYFILFNEFSHNSVNCAYWHTLLIPFGVISIVVLYKSKFIMFLLRRILPFSGEYPENFNDL